MNGSSRNSKSQWQKQGRKRENELTKSRGDYHERVPAITVIVDGSNHLYNTNSGVAIMIGKATCKLLFIDVRNKYCSACSMNIPPDKTTATETVRHHLQRRIPTLSWRGCRSMTEYMELGIQSSLAIVIVYG